MTYRVERDSAPREPFAEYRYRIFRDNVLVAHFWHDYRGDENGVEFVGGASESDPVRHPGRFLEGGGPTPLGLSKSAVAYLESRLATAS